MAGPAFPTAQHFGTIRGSPFVSQQDGINSMSMRPAPPINRPTVAPPRPPTEAKAPAVKEVDHKHIQSIHLQCMTINAISANYSKHLVQLHQRNDLRVVPRVHHPRLFEAYRIQIYQRFH